MRKIETKLLWNGSDFIFLFYVSNFGLFKKLSKLAEFLSVFILPLMLILSFCIAVII